MGRPRSDVEKQVAALLVTAKDSLGLSLTFLSRLDGTTQHLEVVESSIPFVFKDGNTQPQQSSLCQAILDKKIPAVIPDLTALPEAMKLPAARFPRIRSFVSVPVILSDGTVYGTFCGAGLRRDKGLSKRDESLMTVLARAAAAIIEPEVVHRAREAEILARFRPVLDDAGPVMLLQPIVDLATGLRVGAEALSRFPGEWGKAPDVCFAEAHSVGQGDLLERLAVQAGADHLSRVSGYIAVNVSPGTLLTAECQALLRTLALDRILLELSEHDQVQDYTSLLSALAPLRARGMRLAIDDVGAGFSSLRHIVLTDPDVIKLDRSIVDGISADPVLTTLVRSMVAFGHGCNARVVAEGVETAADAAALLALGVDYGQGWYFGRPGSPDVLSDSADSPEPEPVRTSTPIEARSLG